MNNQLKSIKYNGYTYYYSNEVNPIDRESICLATKNPDEYCNGFYLYSKKDPSSGRPFVVIDHNNPNKKWMDNRDTKIFYRELIENSFEQYMTKYIEVPYEINTEYVYKKSLIDTDVYRTACDEISEFESNGFDEKHPFNVILVPEQSFDWETELSFSYSLVTTNTIKEEYDYIYSRIDSMLSDYDKLNKLIGFDGGRVDMLNDLLSR